MKFNLDFLESYSVFKTSALGALLVALSIAGGYFAVYDPLSAELKQKEEEIAALKAAIAKETSLRLKQSAVKEKLKLAKNIQNLASVQLPEQKDMPGILSAVEGLGKEIGVKVISFIPSKEIVRDFYVEIPILLKVEATFEQLQMFVDELSRFGRIIFVEELALSNPKAYQLSGRVSLSGSLKVLAFRQLTPAEAEEIAKKSQQEAQDVKKRGLQADEEFSKTGLIKR